MPLLIYSRFFRLQVCLNLFFLNYAYEINHMWTADMTSNEEWSSQLLSQFLQLRKEAWKKFRTSTGLEPVTSRYRCNSCLSSELLTFLEFSSRGIASFLSFSVSHSWSKHLFCDLHLVLLPLAFNPASLHASTKVSLINSDAVSMLSCVTAAFNLDWTVCDLRPSLSLSLDLIFQKSLL